jgi:hypothetical protein
MISFPYFQPLSDKSDLFVKLAFILQNPISNEKPVPAQHFEQGAK